MKIILFILFIVSSAVCIGQQGVDVFILDCSTLSTLEQKKDCTDELIINDISSKWQTINSKVKNGIYFVEYTVYSDGKVSANTIKRIPDVVDPSNEMEALKKLVDDILKGYEWNLPIKMEGITTGVSKYLKINTSRL